MQFAVVDIETTGGYATGCGITEISVQVFDGMRVVEQFNTLINPGHSIPYYIRGLTGITDAMVADAPAFEEVAAQIHTILSDRIFVAHNVNFDYSFVKHQLAEAGYDLNAKKLCTIRLSRKIFPGHPSYSLGNLCSSLSIPITDRHRASGDAAATVKLLSLLIENDKEEIINKFLKRNSKEATLPPNLPKENFDKLPETPGVYYFHDQKGKVVYVGKAINIKKRVTSHFSNNSGGKQKQDFLRSIYSMHYEECGNELMALILESHEIRRLWPRFNQSQKRFEPVFGLYEYTDQRGFKRLGLEKIKKNITPWLTFNNLAEGYSTVRKAIEEFDLCPRLTGIATDVNQCIEKNCICQEADKTHVVQYNKRMETAAAHLIQNDSFVITEAGRTENEIALVVVAGGSFKKMGYIPANEFEKDKLTPAALDNLPPYKENFNIRSIISTYAYTNPQNVVFI